MRYTVVFEREIITTETVKREIEATSEDDARAEAEQMADEFNGDCPDDARPEASDICGDWSVRQLHG